MDEQKDITPREASQFRERVVKEVENLSSPEILKSTLDKIQTTVGVEGFDFLSNPQKYIKISTYTLKRCFFSK